MRRTEFFLFARAPISTNDAYTMICALLNWRLPIDKQVSCDLNGVVDFCDIAPFIDILSSGVFLDQADCNQDGVVDFFDIAPFIDILAM